MIMHNLVSSSFWCSRRAVPNPDSRRLSHSFILFDHISDVKILNVLRTDTRQACTLVQVFFVQKLSDSPLATCPQEDPPRRQTKSLDPVSHSVAGIWSCLHELLICLGLAKQEIHGVLPVFKLNSVTCPKNQLPRRHSVCTFSPG